MSLLKIKCLSFLIQARGEARVNFLTARKRSSPEGALSNTSESLKILPSVHLCSHHMHTILQSALFWCMKSNLGRNLTIVFCSVKYEMYIVYTQYVKAPSELMCIQAKIFQQTMQDIYTLWEFGTLTDGMCRDRGRGRCVLLLLFKLVVFTIGQRKTISI